MLPLSHFFNLKRFSNLTGLILIEWILIAVGFSTRPLLAIEAIYSYIVNSCIKWCLKADNKKM